MLMHRRTFLAATAVPALLPSVARTASGTIETRDGQRLFTIDKGAGRPVVFIHGWTLSSAIWNLQIEALASRVVVGEQRDAVAGVGGRDGTVGQGT